MSRAVNINGKKYGRLTVIKLYGKCSRGRLVWVCSCECGNTKNVKSNALRSGGTKSCGCIRVETATRDSTKHGMCGSKIYRAWVGIKNRCLNDSSPSWARYGGRGIGICDTWVNSFDQFYKDMGEPPSNDHSIDRIDNNGNYEPSNCRWATRKEQARNRNYLKRYEHKGRSLVLAEIAEIENIDHIKLISRMCNKNPNLKSAVVELKGIK